MVEVTVHHNTVVFTVRGSHKVFGFKSELTVPRAHIIEVRPDPEVARHLEGGRPHGPGVVTAGAFHFGHHGSPPLFADVANPDNVVVIKLRDEEYRQLIIEVDDPVAVVALLATSG
jgi:hypothetical protein